ncbi:hypothetical protein [Flammeovirga kamogawensis]|uniref:Uncharacterized protein n=1 Tax=Flammeovirga kamogawensis TaxID=373891 RepID=A0ABX8GY28_9BACT|nr:hypothetical protein [Flammeovirga kamogawensis]MBB6460953.1 hypothetical protein [Flammeovirga kamogawensis]QWG08294.1 hypothetical protein KM029_04990 [Flammeovirga kamogawensis]TRX66592.1 hypothetical protein EO216_00060 [Flammeovirga kamogawensis]
MYRRKEKLYKYLINTIENNKNNLSKSSSLLNRLRRLFLMPSVSDEVSTGRIFETESTIFVIGAKLPMVNYSGKRIVGLTTDSPLYRLFKGKKNGDEVQYGKDIEHISFF